MSRLILEAFVQKELNEIQEIFPKGRRNDGFTAALQIIDRFTYGDIIGLKMPDMKYQCFDENGKLTYESASTYEELNIRSLEQQLKFFEKEAAKGHDISRMRRCDHCDKWFEVKRTDSQYCSTNCRVQNNQEVQHERKFIKSIEKTRALVANSNISPERKKELQDWLTKVEPFEQTARDRIEYEIASK